MSIDLALTSKDRVLIGDTYLTILKNYCISSNNLFCPNNVNMYDTIKIVSPWAYNCSKSFFRRLFFNYIFFWGGGKRGLRLEGSL